MSVVSARVEDASGHLLGHLHMPAFEEMPEVAVWDDTAYVLDNGVYREAHTYYVGAHHGKAYGVKDEPAEREMKVADD